jgi:four helix bundle protein
MKDFRTLTVWQTAQALTLGIYRVTRRFPKDEVYGLSSQMRRSSASVAANIAEGCGRRTDADFSRFLQNAFGSASELEYHLILAHDLHYLGDSEYEDRSSQAVEVKKMLASLMRKLNAER